MKRIIKFKNGSEIAVDVDEFDMDWSEEWEMAKKVLMPKLNLKEHPIIILETPSSKEGFFYKLWNDSND